ncbi:hypothetical protein Tco_1340377, partial [Tanacetum coccineum]
MVINSPCLTYKKELAIPGQTGNCDENIEFHQIVDFFSSCSINYALTVSPTIYASYIEQFWNTATSKTINSVKQIHNIIDGKAVVISESLVRSDLLFDDEDAPKGEGSSIPPEPQPIPSTLQPNVSKPQIKSLQTKAPPTAAPQTEAPYTYKWQSQVPRNHGGTPAQTRSERVLEQPSELPLPKGHTSGSRQGSMEHLFELTNHVPPTPYDSPLTGGYTPGIDEGRMKLDELITLCTKMSKQVLDLETEKDAQAVEILKLKKREDASKQGRSSDKMKQMFQDSDFDDLENVVKEPINAATTGVSTVSAPVTTAGVAISTAEPKTPPTTTTIFDDEDVTMAMAQTLIKMKEQKPKEKGVAITDVEDSSRTVRHVRSITTLQPLPTIDPKDKVGSVTASRGVSRVRKARIDADYELAPTMTQEEQEKYTIEERA